MLRKNYYLVLGVGRTESMSRIRQAFRELAGRYHPDRVGARYLSLFQQIVEAYRVLSDPQQRRNYDQGLAHAGTGAGSLLAPVIVDASAGAEMLVPEVRLPLRVEINRLHFESALAKIADWATTAGELSEQAEGLTVQVILSPEQAALGGTGFISVPGCSPCWRCGASGYEGLSPCSFCEGEGVVEEEEEVRIHFPPMVGDGTRMELPLRALGVHNFYLRAYIRVLL